MELSTKEMKFAIMTYVSTKDTQISGDNQRKLDILGGFFLGSTKTELNILALHVYQADHAKTTFVYRLIQKWQQEEQEQREEIIRQKQEEQKREEMIEAKRLSHTNVYKAEKLEILTYIGYKLTGNMGRTSVLHAIFSNKLGDITTLSKIINECNNIEILGQALSMIREWKTNPKGQPNKDKSI